MFWFSVGSVRRAIGNIRGIINDVDFDHGLVIANVTYTDLSTRVSGLVLDIPGRIGKVLGLDIRIRVDLH